MYRYQIVPKSKSIFVEIKDFIRGHQGKSGIIYCCTRKDCELVAEKLSVGFGISIKYYHAAMTSPERTIVQKEWQTGKIQVIAATIAFGMGIDKPDVRFVIHYSIPSSLEGYYQETGRAGRDGLPATCRMYYSFGDTKTHSFLIDQGDGNWQQKQRQRDNLNTMIRFCENHIDCRRKQIMSYFGERFDPALCQKMCDNCLNNQHTQSVMRDMSKDAIALVKSVRQMEPDRVTRVQLIDVYRGSRNKRNIEHGFDKLQGYGYGKSKDRNEADRLLRSMVADDVIREKAECNAGGFPISYISVSIIMFISSSFFLTSSI
jgi:RecQ family ATP-dependent DNA helicase